jgi:pimeloyl-ACP methyl ester carboxylesterase
MGLSPSGFLNTDVGNIEFRWIEPTRGNAVTLVLLHEGLGCVSMWKDFPDQLATTTGCGILVYSRPGYGKSDPITLPRPLTYMHTEATVILPAVLHKAGIDRCVLVGHSDGASISIIHTGCVHSSSVLGAVLIAPHVFVESVSIKSIEHARDAYTDTNLREKLKRHHGDNVDITFHGWNQAWLDPAFLIWNIEEYLPDIAVPLLLLQGLNDEYGTLAQLDRIEKSVTTRVTRHELSDCRHSPHKDQSALTVEYIRCFVSNVENNQ